MAMCSQKANDTYVSLDLNTHTKNSATRLRSKMVLPLIFQNSYPGYCFGYLFASSDPPSLLLQNRKNLVSQVHCPLISSLTLIILFLVLCELNPLPMRIRSHAHRRQCLVLADFIREIGEADQRISTFVIWRHHRAVCPLPFDS